MGDDAVFAAQQRRVTEQLGAAMLAAVGLMVRQYLGAPTGENEGQDSADAAWEDGAQAFRAGETVNESFDMARYLRLRQGASAAEPEESEGRADAEDRSRSVRRTAEKTTSARTAAGDAGARGSGERSASAAAPESGAGRHDAAEAFVSAEGGDALRTARSVSGEIERDARRYDGGFYLLSANGVNTPDRIGEIRGNSLCDAWDMLHKPLTEAGT